MKRNKKICPYIGLEGDSVVCNFFNEPVVIGDVRDYAGTKCKYCQYKTVPVNLRYGFTENTTQQIKVKYLRPVTKIEKTNNGDWLDLRCAKSTFLKKGESAIIPLGVAMQLPKGFEALLVPRSSTFRKYKIIQTNSIGVIDESYCGDDDEWGLPVYATEDTQIPFDVRICQFRIFKHQNPAIFTEVETMNNKDRGGFGSTGD